MKHKLLGKCIAVYLIFLVLNIVLFFKIIPSRLYDHLLQNKVNTLTNAAEKLAEAPRIYSCNFTDSAQETKKLIDSISSAQNGDIWLANQDGRVFMCSRYNYPLTQSIVIPDFDSDIHTRTYWVIGDFWGMFPQETLTVMAPVTIVPHTADYVIIHYSLRNLKMERDKLVNVCTVFLLMFLLTSLVLPAAFYFFFYRPFLHTLQLSDDYASGRLNIPLPENREDEFSLLHTNLGYMAKEIRQSGEYQRNFVSNISHDFRSPLTSIKGYAEAILDGTIPRESQDKYLQIILTETERLTHLTQNILIFNNLNDNCTFLERSVFDINEVIRTIAASMEIQCRKKDLKIILFLSDNAQNVNADKEKIQQVIYNLLDNAIKFSYSHSSIEISASRKMKYVYVSVKDSGEGIPANDIPKIWNRFYKSDTSRGKDKRGTGLGLSIVREIIQAHEQNVNVISTVGVGSEFIFSLDKA